MNVSPRDALQKFVDLLRGGQRGRIQAKLTEIERWVAEENWDRAIALARDAAAMAQSAGHFGLVSRAGRALEQLGEFEAAAPLRFAAERRSYRSNLPAWNGEETDACLLVDQVFSHVGQQLRHARLIAVAAVRARKCIALAEPRLMPLIQRTFSNVEVVDEADRLSAARRADLTTNAWDLAMRFANSGAAIAAGFLPLKPDPTLLEFFGASYAARSRRPLIGFSWRTSNASRSVPMLSDWGTLLTSIPATFVSLQYGEVSSDIGFFERSGIRLINDLSVDQLVDMDRFAAQISSLDLVVTIDNTVAHTAAALGKPTIVLTDDGASHWPLRGDRTPWYPSATVVRRRGRTWREAVEEARRRCDSALVEIPTAKR
jgi:hypothetical protein